MQVSPLPYTRCGTLLAINSLFLVVWGFAGIGKLLAGYPDWFAGKFGNTILSTVPGLKASFWILAISEVLAFALGVGALVRTEFLGNKPPVWLTWMLVWSLFVFIQLGFGQWLTSEFNGTAQLFSYFAGTLISLQIVAGTELQRPNDR